MHPLVKQLFEEIERQDTNILWVSEQAGLSSTCMYAWKNDRRDPGIVNFDKALKALGFSLSVEGE